MTTKRPTKKAPPDAGAIQARIDPQLAEEIFNVQAALAGFDLRGFDAWLATLPEAGNMTELPERRSLAKAAAMPPKPNYDALRRHLEWMLLRWKQIRREEYVLPLARTGKKVRDPFKEANLAHADLAESMHATWQDRANKKWAEPQHANKSARAIALLIAEPGENPDTIRRRIKKLA